MNQTLFSSRLFHWRGTGIVVESTIFSDSHW